MRTAKRNGVLAAFTLTLLAPAAASAAPAKTFTTDAFSIELGPTPVCFALPVSLRDATACKGLPPAGANDIDTTQIGLIAAGGIRRATGEAAAPGTMPIAGLIQVFRAPASNVTQPDVASAERAGVEATKAILANLPTEARRTKVIPRIETVDGLVVVRTTVDVDDLTPGTRASFFGHIETSTVFGRDATYTVVWSGPADPATATKLARLADDTTKTMRLVPGQRPDSREATAASLAGLRATFGSALIPVGVLAVAGVLASALYLRKRRSKGTRLREELWPVHD